MNQKTLASIILGIALIAGAIILSDSSSKPVPTQASNNITTENGTQIISIEARGGYSPRKTTAKANTPTILRMNTKNTFDCSSALSIPKLGIQKNLPYTGSTDFTVPPQSAGTKLQGLCVMGMYYFEIQFQ